MYKPTQWVQRDGSRVEITKMTWDHIHNSIAMMERRDRDDRFQVEAILNRLERIKGGLEKRKAMKAAMQEELTNRVALRVKQPMSVKDLSSMCSTCLELRWKPR